MDAGDGASGVLPGLPAVARDMERSPRLAIRSGVAAKQDATVLCDDGAGNHLMPDPVFGLDEHIIDPGFERGRLPPHGEGEILPFSCISDALEMKDFPVIQRQQGTAGHIPVGDLAEIVGRRPGSIFELGIQNHHFPSGFRVGGKPDGQQSSIFRPGNSGLVIVGVKRSMFDCRRDDIGNRFQEDGRNGGLLPFFESDVPIMDKAFP